MVNRKPILMNNWVEVANSFSLRIENPSGIQLDQPPEQLSLIAIAATSINIEMQA